VRAAGIRQIGGAVELLELPGPRVRGLTGGGVDAAANAAPGGAAEALKAVRDGGRLATITSDPPPAEREISVLAVLVAPDGTRLRALAQLLADGALTVTVCGRFPLQQGGAALAQARHGAHGTAVVLQP
jgi:NADPH:quinone reductase-like Zn-dependent oxidoreductase